MSYLRGPLTRTQVRQLMGDRQPDPVTASPLAGTGLAPREPAPITPAATAASDIEQAVSSQSPFASSPPALSPDIDQVYIPARKGKTTVILKVESQEGGPVEMKSCRLLYEPAVLGMGCVHFVDRRKEVDEREEFALMTQAPRSAGGPRWDQAQPLDLRPGALVNRPEPEASFDEVPESINEARDLKALRRDLADHLYRTSVVKLLYSLVLRAYFRPNELERDFRMRLQQVAREARD